MAYKKLDNNTLRYYIKVQVNRTFVFLKSLRKE